MRCLFLLEYNLNKDTSYDILNFFLTNGLIYSQDIFKIRNFYNLSKKILIFFNEDIRSLDFYPSQIALASILRASELINLYNEVKFSLIKVYEIKMSNFANAFFVIKK